MRAKIRKRDGGRCFVRACARKEEGAGVWEIKEEKGDGGGAEDGTREGGR